MGVMAAFIRESMAHDSDDDGDQITLSLGCLDTELSDNAGEYSENPSGESPAKRDRKSCRKVKQQERKGSNSNFVD